MRIIRNLVIVYLAAVVIHAVFSAIPRQAEAQPMATPAFVPSAEIVQLGRQDGLSYDDLVRVKAQFGLPTDAPGPFEGIYENGTVYVSPNATSYAQTLAYEYSHYEWQSLSASDRAFWQPELDQFLANNPDIADWVNRTVQADADNLHSSGREVYYDEAHAVACTEAQDWQLPPGLLGQCNSYLSRTDIPRSF